MSTATAQDSAAGGSAAKTLMQRSGQATGGKAQFSELMKRDSFREVLNKLHGDEEAPDSGNPAGAPALQVNGTAGEYGQPLCRCTQLRARESFAPRFVVLLKLAVLMPFFDAHHTASLLRMLTP